MRLASRPQGPWLIVVSPSVIFCSLLIFVPKVCTLMSGLRCSQHRTHAAFLQKCSARVVRPPCKAWPGCHCTESGTQRNGSSSPPKICGPRLVLGCFILRGSAKYIFQLDALPRRPSHSESFRRKSTEALGEHGRSFDTRRLHIIRRSPEPLSPLSG